MKKLRCCFNSALFLTLLFVAAAVCADTDLLNLSAYQEGVALKYGENVDTDYLLSKCYFWATVLNLKGVN
jgi:hypothetical protein